MKIFINVFFSSSILGNYINDLVNAAYLSLPFSTCKDRTRAVQTVLNHNDNKNSSITEEKKDLTDLNKVQELNEAEINRSKIDISMLKNIYFDVQSKNKLIEDYKRDSKIIMEKPETYSRVKGVTCFRGNNYRDSPSYGYADIRDEKLDILWSISIGAIDEWTGVGWNGQPAIVEWPQELREKMNICNEKKSKNLKEVIYAALDGNVYFLDLDDGKYTRNPIHIPGPVKGSLTIDPRGLPLLYVGQGINKVHGKVVEMGYRIYSLLDQSKLYFINGSDSFAYRRWPAFDSTSIVDERTDTLLIGGENGLFYTVKLNSNYDTNRNIVKINPEVTKYRYRIKGNSYHGIENSVAVYRNLAYFADNGGWLQCVDLNSLKPVWIKYVNDDTDSTVVLEEEGKEASLYTSCEVDKQGTKGLCNIRKIDALTGMTIWEKKYECYSKLGVKPNNGGALATPIVGKNNINNLVIFNIARCGGFNRGRLVALDKKTGDEIWRIDLKNYCWSSPVAVYTKEGKAYIIACDSAGKMFLINGETGKVLDSISLEANVEGSPAVYEDIAVVGTRGERIFGIKLR